MYEALYAESHHECAGPVTVTAVLCRAAQPLCWLSVWQAPANITTRIGAPEHCLVFHAGFQIIKTG